MRKQKDTDRFFHWLEMTATDAERKLRQTATEYENRYFQDLTLEDGRAHKRLAVTQTVSANYSLQAEEVTVSQWIFRYRELRGDRGRCCWLKKTIEIKTGLVGDEFKGVLLHEMIHAYETMLEPQLREWMLLDIYKRMEKKLGERTLRGYIDTNTHRAFRQGDHGTLFLLKSLQLDERFKWKHGTAFAYGRGELFNKKENLP